MNKQENTPSFSDDRRAAHAHIYNAHVKAKGEALKSHKKERHRTFSLFAEHAAWWTGTPPAFLAALSFVLFCAVSGVIFGFSHHWEMVATFVPTMVTFLLVFLIQNSQNRETRAVQLKLNELIRATEGAHTTMVNLEKLTEEDLVIFCEQYELLAHEARKKLKKGETDLTVPDMEIIDGILIP